MGLIADQKIVEILVFVVALFFIDGGLTRRMVSIGLDVINIGLVNSPQAYFNDATNTYIFANYPGTLQNALILMFAMMALITAGLAFAEIFEITKQDVKNWISHII